jgi:putative ABC transport system permease protein
VVVGKDGTAVRNPGAPTLALAYSPQNTTLHVVQGRAPRSAKEIALESSTLQRSQLAVGSTTKALIGTAPQTVTVVGEMKFDAPIAGATMVVLDQDTARAVFAPDGKVSAFSVVAEPGVSQSQLRDRLAAVLPDQAEVINKGRGRGGQEGAARPARLHLDLPAGVRCGSIFVGISSSPTRSRCWWPSGPGAPCRAVGAARAQVLGSPARLPWGRRGSSGSASGWAWQTAPGAVRRVGPEISGGPRFRSAPSGSRCWWAWWSRWSAVFPAVRAARIEPVAAMHDDRPDAAVAAGW